MDDRIFMRAVAFVKLPAGFDGDYNSLTNRPNLFSGSYNDLTDQPTIPTVPTNVGAFTNDAGYITMDSVPTIPSNVSELTNDAGYITAQDIPEIPTVPTNVGAFTNDAGYITMDSVPTIPSNVSDFTNDAGYITAQDIPEIPTVPTNVGAFTNDAGYITAQDIPEIPTVPTNVSAFTNDAGYITKDSVPAGLVGGNTGDIMYWDAATGTWVMMPAGRSGQVLTMENGVPVWASLPDYVTMNMPPTVITTAPTEVTQSSVLCGGVVTSDGSVQLTACGVCWSTHHSPTIADAHTENDLSVSAFTSHISNLTHQTTYYVRAYATNNLGTSYGAEMTFTTTDIPTDSLNMPDPCSTADTNATAQPTTLGPNYLVCAGTDSVELSLNNYQYGSIQWQYSLDTVSWFDIPDAIDEQLTYKPEQTQFVRAAVSYSNCATEYSEVKLLQKTPAANAGISRTANVGDTLRLQANTEESATGSWQILQGSTGILTAPTNASSNFYGIDSLYRLRWTLTNSCGTSSDDINVRYVQPKVSSKVVVVDTTDIIFSDSAQLANGYYVISFSDSSIVIGDSTILVSIVNGGFLRKVDSWEMRDDTTYAMYTSQASLSDLLESGVISFGGISSGSSEEENVVEHAIDHNVPTHNESVQSMSAQSLEFLDHIPTRKELREHPEMNGKMYVMGMGVKNADGSTENLMPESAPKGSIWSDVGVTDETNTLDYKKLYVHATSWSPFSGARLENVEFIMESAGPILHYFSENRQLNFGFDNVRLKITADLVITEDYSLYERDLPLSEGNTEWVYYVDGTPIKCDLDYSVTLHLKGTADITSEMRHRLTVDAKFSKINTLYVNSPNQNSSPIPKANGSTNIELVSDYSPTTADLNVSLAATQNFKLYGVEGPHTKAGYKASIKYNNGSMGWQGKILSDLFVESDLKGADVIDSELPANSWSDSYSSSSDNQHKWFNLHSEKTYPYKMKNVSNLRKTIPTNGHPIPIVVDVYGDDNKPVGNVYVHFEPKNGSSINESMALSDGNGRVLVYWTPGPLNGSEQYLNAYIYDGNNRIVAGPVTFIAYEPESATQSNGCANSTLQLIYRLDQGNLKLIPQNGTSPYTYSSNIGSLGTHDGAINVGNITENVVFTVTDANGCVATLSYNVESTTDCGASNLDLNYQTNGRTITVEGRNGTSPYRYSRDGYHYTSDGEFSSLSEGTYTIHVMDDNGCHFSTEVTIEIDQGSTSLDGVLPCAGAAMVRDIDGNVYHTLQIGQQCWMAENLRTTRYANGEPIGIGGACFYPDNNSNNKLKYGLLYTWYVTTRDSSSSSNPSGVQGVCPNGWHIPSIAEWDQFLNQPQVRGYPAKTLATKYGWESSTTPGSPGFETYNNNGIEFNASPSGYYSGGNFGFGTMARFWTCNHDWQTRSCAYIMDKDNTGINRNCSCEKAQGYSVRCVRD